MLPYIAYMDPMGSSKSMQIGGITCWLRKRRQKISDPVDWTT